MAATSTNPAAPVSLSVQSPWFELLRCGDKVYEGRLDVPPYSSIQPGDLLTVSHSTNPSLPSFPLLVTAVHSFPTFHSALTALPLHSVLPGIADVPAAVALYATFYSTQRQEEHCVRMLRVSTTTAQADTPEGDAGASVAVDRASHALSGPLLSPAPFLSPTPVPSPSLSPSPPSPSPSPCPSSSSSSSSSSHLLDLTFLHSSPLRDSESPGRSHQLDIGLETSQLQRALTSSSRQFRVAFDVCTADRLLSALSCTTALHISGHGDPQHLVMEDGRGDVQGLSVALLQRILGMSSVRRLQFVLVSACYSFRAGLAFAVAGVPHVIAVQEHTQVSDVSARAFAEHVYLALCQGLTVEEAFKRGQAAVINCSTPPCCCAHLHTPPTCSLCRTCRTPVCCTVHAAPCHSPSPLPSSSSLSPSPSSSHRCCQPSLAHDDSLKFCLLPSSTSHAIPLFPHTSSPTSGPWIDRSPPPPSNNLPLPHERFLGRASDTLTLVRDLLKVRLVGLWGAEGVGKTAVGLAMGRYVRDRKHFEEVWLVRLEGVREVRDIDRALARVLGIGDERDKVEEVEEEEEGDEGVALHERVLARLQRLHRRKPVLLIFDDVDGLIQGGSVQRAPLVRAVSDESEPTVWKGDGQQKEGWPEPLVLRGRGKEEKKDEVEEEAKSIQQLQPAKREVVAGAERGRDRARSTEKNNSRALSSPPAMPSPSAAGSSSAAPVGKEEMRKAPPKVKKSGKGYHSILPHDAPRVPAFTTSSSSASSSSSSSSASSSSPPTAARVSPVPSMTTTGEEAWEDDWELIDHDEPAPSQEQPSHTCSPPPRSQSRSRLFRSISSTPTSPVGHSRTVSAGSSFSLHSLLPSSFSSTAPSPLSRAQSTTTSPQPSPPTSLFKRLVGLKDKASRPRPFSPLPSRGDAAQVEGKRKEGERQGEVEGETAGGETWETHEGGEGGMEGLSVDGLTAHDEEVVCAAERMGFPRSRCCQALQLLRAQRVAEMAGMEEVQVEGAAPSPSSAVLVQREGVDSSPTPLPLSPNDEGEWGMEGVPRVDVEVSLQSLLTHVLDHEGDADRAEGEEEGGRRAPLVHLSLDSLEQDAQQQLLLSPCIYLSPLVDEQPPPSSPAPPSPTLPATPLLRSSSSSSSLCAWLDAHSFTDLFPTLHSASILSLSHLLTLDDSALLSAGICPLGRRKALLQALRREASHRRRSSALTGRAAFTSYVLSLLDHTSCHVLLTSRTRPPHFAPYPCRQHRLAPLHPLDTALLLVHRLSHALSSADLLPYKASCLQELALHPLVALLQGNARVVERVAEAERVMGMRKVWELMAAEEEQKEGEAEAQSGAVAEATRMVHEARRLARLARKDEAERKAVATLAVQPTRSVPPSSPLTASRSPSLSPVLSSPPETASLAMPPSAQPSSVLSLFDAMQGHGRGTGMVLRPQPRSPAFSSSATSSSLYPASIRT